MADQIKNAANSVSETVQQYTSGASKEANKNVAKNDDANLGTRASAAKDATKDKFDEIKHDNAASANKSSLGNN